MRDLIGRTLGHYRIVEKIGEGGMGVVYRAHDERLDRDVAIKVLPEAVAQDEERLARFEWEAKAVGSLNHPNILTVHEIDTFEGQPFIVTELLEGETLREVVGKGGISSRKAVEYARHIAKGLAAAHDKGITHRDLKPENIFLTQDGHIKILDFGLAKLLQLDAEPGDVGELPTETLRTGPGIVMGTPGYMAPEQLQGKTVDHRSDIFSFGVVLYEMLAGRRPFQGDSKAQVAASVLRNEPQLLSNSVSAVSPTLDRIVQQCLEKRPEDRFESARDLAHMLKAVSDTGEDEVSVEAPPRRRGWLRAAVVSLVTVAVVVLALLFYPFSGRAGVRHLLVLPFNCPEADTQSELLCAGLLDIVTAKLTELRRFQTHLSVVPVSEVLGQRVSSADMAHRIFGVDLVVSGSVLRVSDSLRIPVQLVDATRLRQLRSQTITTEGTTDLVLQDRVVATIEEMLDVELGVEERNALMAGGTRSAEAGELYLEARGRTGEEPSEGQLIQAMTLYRQALELDPDFAEAIVQLADVCEQRYELSQDPIWLQHGADYAQRGVAVAPDLPAAQLVAGRFELAISSYDDAIEHLQRAIALDPLNIHAYVYLADAYQATGEPELAEEMLEWAVRTGPNDWGTHQELGRLYINRGDWERAAGYFRRVTQLLPDSSIGYTSLGGCYIYLDDLKAARENLERAVEIGSGYWAYSNLATLEYWEGNYQRAADLYRQALEMDDSDYQVWNNLGEALRQQVTPDLQGALAAYRRAAELIAARLEVTPDDVKLLIDLASYRVQLGDEVAARGLLTRILTLDITSSRRMFDLASLCEELGERDEAIGWLGHALEAGFPLHVIESYPVFAGLVEDSRFQALLKKYDTN